MDELSKQQIATIVSSMHDHCALKFDGYRQSTLRRRIANRISALHVDSATDYLAYLAETPGEYAHLVSAITVNVSHFFRNPIVFEILAQRLLPEMIERKEREGFRNLRLWSAGCAGGEEAYSLSILLERELKNEIDRWSSSVFATDIDRQSLQRAEQARFSQAQLLDTKLGDVLSYFSAIDEGYQVCQSVRGRVSFSYDDLTSEALAAPTDSVFCNFDLVLCRNVLIYFSAQVQDLVLQKICRTLGSGGYLILGEAESLSASVADQFLEIDGRNRIYRKR